MKIAVFSKRRTGKDGRTFWSYFGRLTKKDGTEVPVNVKFKGDEADIPMYFPMNIIFEKKDGNLSQQNYTDEKTGEQRVSYTLWLNRWTCEEYEDSSLDDFI